jgi:hypothetical protein
LFIFISVKCDPVMTAFCCCLLRCADPWYNRTHFLRLILFLVWIMA